MVEAIVVKNLHKTYGGEVKTVVFEGASMSIDKGEFVGLFAPSGYGKSTLIFLLAGLDSPDTGEIIIAGRDITKMSERERTIFRRKHIGIVFQFFNLIPTLTALENVMLPMRLIGVSGEEARKRAMELLKDVGLEPEHYNKLPHQLSGGQQQRVAIARALANNPDVLLLDEPTGSLDERNAVRIFELLRDLNESYGVTILLSTHDVEHAKKYVKKALTIKNRKIVEVDL